MTLSKSLLIFSSKNYKNSKSYDFNKLFSKQKRNEKIKLKIITQITYMFSLSFQSLKVYPSFENLRKTHKAQVIYLFELNIFFGFEIEKFWIFFK